MFRMIALCAALALCAHPMAQPKSKGAESATTKAAKLGGLAFRNVGPALVSGRVIDLAVNPKNNANFYVAAACGGVWRTTNHGTTFEPIFDNYGSYSIGCLAIDPMDEHTLWVGTGENNNQRSVGYGDGIYLSVNGGKSFENKGLKNSEHIAKIVVHPHRRGTVLVAAYGPLWSDGGDRGIYRTTDGGTTWERVLHVSEQTGFSDLWIDPFNADVFYASAHQRRRHVWTYLGGGPETAIYKSTDGGTTWRKITSGLPEGDLGRIALAPSPAQQGLIYALVEGYDKEHGGFYMSANGGESWSRQSDHYTAGNYYAELIPDPKNAKRVFSMDTWLTHTDDGGKSFKETGEKNKHVDNHALWIDPADTRHWLVGCDGGLYETWDEAATWKFYQNLNITQFYRVAVDKAKPFYNIYGGTQDNNTIGGPSRTTNSHGISNFDWFITLGGDGFEPQIDPTNPDIIYSQAQYGYLARFNKVTGEAVFIRPMESPGEAPYRWNWDAPLLISPHSPTRLYFAANRLFKSDNRGNGWKAISPDLTKQTDRNTLKVMGKTWGLDAVAYHQSTSIFGNIVALDESPLAAGVIAVGTDDGLIQITENDGGNWRKLEAFPGVPAGAYVSAIRFDKHDKRTLYAAFDNHKNGDFKPYLLRSTDLGATWTSIASNLPARGSVLCFQQDHLAPQLIFVGTEFGAFTSRDGGKEWLKLPGLPTIAIRDLDIQTEASDLVAASFGRGFYVMDNYQLLRELNDTTAITNGIVSVSDAWWFTPTTPLGDLDKGSQGESFFTTPNPEFGAAIDFYLKEKPQNAAQQRRELEKAAAKSGAAINYPKPEAIKEEALQTEPYVLVEIYDPQKTLVSRYKVTEFDKGLNRTYWNLRTETTTPVKLTDPKPGRYSTPDLGPMATPGNYAARIAVWDGKSLSEYCEPVAFQVKALHDQNTAVQIEKWTALAELAEVRKQCHADFETLKELERTLQFAERAFMQAPQSKQNLLVELERLRREVASVRIAYVGDGVLASREIPVEPSLFDRLESVAGNAFNHTEALTETEKANLRIVREASAGLSSRIDSLGSAVKSLAENLDDAGAPYFPR